MRKTISSHTVTSTAPKAALIMLLSGLLILVISTFFSLKAQSPVVLARPIGTVSLFSGALAGGFYAAKCLKDGQAYAASAIASALLIAVIIVTKFFIPASTAGLPLWLSPILHCAVIPFSFLGTLIGQKQPIKRKKHKKHKRN
ncbi:MAG: hypothetical protein ACI3XI_02435 [Eubacteriales bacterium]